MTDAMLMFIGSGGRRPASTKRKFRIKGISANGAVARDLFAFRPTGVSLESLREAVAAFLASLRDEQREAAIFPVESRCGEPGATFTVTCSARAPQCRAE